MTFCGGCGTRLAQADDAGDAGRRRGRTALILSVAAVLVVAALGVTGWQEHWPPGLFRSGPPRPLSWSAAQAPLPADAATGNAQNAQLDGVACASAGSCVAVGSYEKTSGSGTRFAGLIETLAGGTWHPVAAPGLTGAQNAFVGLAGIACPAAGSCVSVGQRSDGRGSGSPVSEILSAGSWTVGSPALPADADHSKWASLNDISCVAPGTCVATGRYTDLNGDSEGLLDALSDGTWTATRAPLPADADQGKATGNAAQTTILTDIACTAAGACVATGQYADSSGGMEGLTDTLSGGNWTAATAPLPADAAASGQLAALWTITCQGPGSCLAGGHYMDKHGQARYLVDSLSGGAWATMPDALPANAAADQQWSKLQATALNGLACRAAGSCVAAASYVTGKGAVDAAVSTLSGGTWRTASLPLPPGAAAAASQYAYPTLVACPEPDSCFTVGSYKAAGGIQQGLIETATGGTATGKQG